MDIHPSRVLKLDNGSWYYSDSIGHIQGPFVSKDEMTRYAEFHEHALVIKDNNSTGTMVLLGTAAVLEGIGDGFRSFFKVCLFIAAVIFIIYAIADRTTQSVYTPETQMMYERAK